MGEVTDYRFAVGELCDVVEHLLEFLHPSTGHEQAGEEEAYERAQAAVKRYREAL